MVGVQFPVEAGTLLMLTSQPPVHGYYRLFFLVKGADHSPSSNCKVKNVWNFISMVPVCLQCLVQTCGKLALEEQLTAFTLRNFCLFVKGKAVSCCEIFTIPIQCFFFF
jgi:hypothetical protein